MTFEEYQERRSQWIRDQAAAVAAAAAADAAAADKSRATIIAEWDSWKESDQPTLFEREGVGALRTLYELIVRNERIDQVSPPTQIRAVTCDHR